MSSRLVARGVLALFVVAIGLGGSPADGQSLQYQWKQGQKFSYQVDITAELIDTTEHMTGVIHYEVISASNPMSVTFKGGLNRETKKIPGKSTRSPSRSNPTHPAHFHAPVAPMPAFGHMFGRTSKPKNPYQGLEQTTGEILIGQDGEVIAIDGSTTLPHLLGELATLPFENLGGQQNSLGGWNTENVVAMRRQSKTAGTPKFAAAVEHTTFSRSTSSSNLLTYAKKFRTDMPKRDDGVALTIEGTGKWVFDRELGISSSLDYQQKLVVHVDNTEIRLPFTVKYHHLSSATLAKMKADKLAEEKRRLDEQKRVAAEQAAMKLIQLAAKFENSNQLSVQDRQAYLSVLKSSNSTRLEQTLSKLSWMSRRDDPQMAEAIRPHLKANSERIAQIADLALAKHSPKDYIDYAYRNRIELKPADLGAQLTVGSDIPLEASVAVKAQQRPGAYAARIVGVEGNDEVNVVFRGETGVHRRKLTDVYLKPTSVNRSSSGIVAISPTAINSASTPAVSRPATQNSAASASYRTWTDSSGKFSVEAKMLELDGDFVQLQRKDSKKFRIQVARLSEADKRYVSSQASSPQVSKAGAINLLEMINLDEHTSRGTWSWQGDMLYGNSVGTVMVPYAPPEEYEIRMVVERLDGARSIMLGLVAPNGKDFNLFLDAYSGRYSGIGVYKGKDVNSGDNPMRVQGRILENDKKTTIVCTVKKDRLVVVVGDKTIVDHQPDYSQLQRSGFWPSPRKDWLYIAMNRAPYRISELSLKPL